MAADALVDTGAILALMDGTNRWHEVCVDTFQQLRLPLVTSEAVLTEVFHCSATTSRNGDGLEVERSGAIRLVVIEDSELSAIQTLMLRYWDRPMDFADATLVYLARREGLSTVFTVDHADFNTYRIAGRKRFRILPAIGP